MFGMSGHPFVCLHAGVCAPVTVLPQMHCND
jgi:hypothetical protein